MDKVPYIKMLTENNTRQGFFEHAQFLALRDVLPEYVRGFATFAYKSGWRLGEISKLTWSRVHLKEGRVRLETGKTKNKDARNFYFDEELAGVLQAQWEGRKKAGRLSPYELLNKTGDEPGLQFPQRLGEGPGGSRPGQEIVS